MVLCTIKMIVCWVDLGLGLAKNAHTENNATQKTMHTHKRFTHKTQQQKRTVHTETRAYSMRNHNRVFVHYCNLPLIDKIPVETTIIHWKIEDAVFS
jgi:hypothetical protein